MPLSEHEQRLLEQIEQGLEAEDPKFAATVRRAKAQRVRRGRRGLILAGLGVLVGLGVVLLALLTKIVLLGVVGFLIIVAAAFYGLVSMTDRTSASGPLGVIDPDGSTRARRTTGSGLRDRMEDRIRRRFDEN